MHILDESNGKLFIISEIWMNFSKKSDVRLKLNRIWNSSEYFITLPVQVQCTTKQKKDRKWNFSMVCVPLYYIQINMQQILTSILMLYPTLHTIHVRSVSEVQRFKNKCKNFVHIFNEWSAFDAWKVVNCTPKM